MTEKLTVLESVARLWRRHQVFLIIVGIVLAIAVYVAGVPHNPPGFYIDESSIAYNAHTISQTGRDEYGVSWPLYFRAFGEYKNPIYIYLLAALYRLTGPSILVARSLSVILGLAAALLLGILARQMTRRWSVGVIVGVTALFTPWFFELSRLVVEVAVYPLVLAFFLLVLHHASTKTRWSQLNIAGLALTMGLFTYSYSIGRLLAPLLAAGLIFFVTRRRWLAIVETWALYAIALIPLLVFNQGNPGALLARFGWVTYITHSITPREIIWEFIKHYIYNINPWKLLVTGDSSQVIHIPSMGSMLIAPAMLIAAGIVLVWRKYRRDAWWRYTFYGVVVSVVPASLTRDHYPSLRLIALPVFLLTLSIPAFAWLLDDSAVRPMRRYVMGIVLIATALQVAIFQWRFHFTYQQSSERMLVYDARYPEVFAAAIALGVKPIYLIDAPGKPGYIHAYWYGTLRGLDASWFVTLPRGTNVPAGAVVISGESIPPGSQVIARYESYCAYIASSQFTVTQGNATPR